ncbi:MAG: iron-sulfur cluster repair di-iron protein [Sphingobacteriales bacterium]|jgi:regulator of cell morphogenesis and NO signaling|nr:iron-sulfur cluster repair di-iron protein [Sphingobacteriales bacterium]MBP9140724.1 iron-sulfur cluster repair di-iron protein [Chitinophagales bacterium]MDA0197972.1 iron-sulfur cluster repair di-iron protein [Bacteroidota bacterium]MBK6890523.1 iron-sulfur cluster repair di-iron protein [Sphingobacteriales bacterium]MBK7526425.1 iron-sulfur cluster repair di-iron protein [Sphingobacteriales bacterium]
MNITKQTVIGELVAQDYRTASVFKKNGIDFCCNGNRNIEEACTHKKKNADELIQHLNEVTAQKNDASGVDFNSWPLDLLADYIEKKHHRYVVTRIQEIAPFLHKVARVHGDRHPELIEVEQLFRGTAEDLTNHMEKEEMVLFPFIRKMVSAKQSGTPISAPFGTVQNPINMMKHEHNVEGDRFRKISELTQNYTPPIDACNTYRVTFAMLEEFENDLHQHIHLENNILFPKAIEMESSAS